MTLNAFPLMAQAAATFCARLCAEQDCTALPLPVIDLMQAPAAADLQWDNVLLRSRTFRRAHVETFNVPGRLSVLHVCIFPHIDDASPVYGFDMVAGPSRVTGIFLDLSPVTQPSASLRLPDVVDTATLTGFAMPRALPEWGDIFSTDMLAVRPVSSAEVALALNLAVTALDGALLAPRSSAVVPTAEIAFGQQRYIAGQRRNDHTFRMLSGFVGPDAARRFIDDVLFPHVDSMPQATPTPNAQLACAW